jgi:plastocyanin
MSALVTLLLLAACGDDDSDGPVMVQIPEFAFDPSPVRVDVGDSVAWENTHSQPHTSSGNGDQVWDTGSIQPGEASEPVTFDEAGTFTYICGLHPFMEGTVEVAA